MHGQVINMSDITTHNFALTSSSDGEVSISLSSLGKESELESGSLVCGSGLSFILWVDCPDPPNVFSLR